MRTYQDTTGLYVFLLSKSFIISFTDTIKKNQILEYNFADQY